MKDIRVLSRQQYRDTDWWSIDAKLSLQAILDDPQCPPLMRQTLTGEMVWQDRNRRQIQRALRSAKVAPRWSAALLALGARASVQGDDGSVRVPVETLLAVKESVDIAELHVPVRGLSWGEAHVGRTPADEPIVAAVAAVAIEAGVVTEVRVALTGIWSRPVGLATAPAQLLGRPLDKDSILAVAAAVEDEVEPEGDFRGSEEYRRAMAGVLTRRVLEQCLEKETG